MNNENVDTVLPQPEQEEYTLEEMMAILERNENKIARVAAGKVLDEVLPQPKTEYTLEELLAELDKRRAQSHGC